MTKIEFETHLRMVEALIDTGNTDRLQAIIKKTLREIEIEKKQSTEEN